MQSQGIKKELEIIRSLTSDEAFASVIADRLHSSYYNGLGQKPPPFLLPADEKTTVTGSAVNENIAINLTYFYALTSTVDALSAKTNEPPLNWIERFATGTADSDAVFLLNRFADATWKAGQPFQHLNSISCPDFESIDFPDANGIKENVRQLKNAAIKLLSSLRSVKKTTLHEQMLVVRDLLQDPTYAEEMAKHLQTSETQSRDQEPTSFSKNNESIEKTEKQIKIATNLAGFYAMECAVNYLATTEHVLPSVLLQHLLNKTLPKEKQTLFARFANATWKAGQPFRGLERITRPVFVPFYFMSEADVEKDLVQVRAAAEIVLPFLTQRSGS